MIEESGRTSFTMIPRQALQRRRPPRGHAADLGSSPDRFAALYDMLKSPVHPILWCRLVYEPCREGVRRSLFVQMHSCHIECITELAVTMGG